MDATPPPKKKRQKKKVFDNPTVEALAIQYKCKVDSHTYQRICAETNNLIDAIIRSKRFDRTVPFEDIKNHLFLQLENWIMKWVPGQGKIYTYFTICIRNGCLSYLAKEQLFRQRFAVTDVPLDTLGEGLITTPEFGVDVQESMDSALRDLYCRWSEPVIQEIIRYMIACVLKHRGDRRPQIMRTVLLGWPVQLDTARFLLDWTHGAVRHVLLEHFQHPMGEVDVVRAAKKFSFIPDIIDTIGLGPTKKLMNVFAGISIKFPSIQQIRRWQEMVAIYESMTENPNPENIKRLSKRYRRSVAKVQEAFDTVAENLRAGVLEDIPLYPEGSKLPKVAR